MHSAALHTAIGALTRALKGLPHRYRADEVPPALLPVFLLYGHALGFLLHAYLRLVRRTSVITSDRPSCSSNSILCGWHESLWPCVVALGARPGQVWLVNPDWYVFPVHVLLRRMGIELILGSTGHSGRRAADLLLSRLQAGATTILAPDGPSGPARQLRKGVLHLSAQSGVPIVPVRFHCSRCLQLGGWDRQIVPLPFCRIKVSHGAPIWAQPGSLERAAAELTSAL